MTAERLTQLLSLVKANLVLSHNSDDTILAMHIRAAMDYAGKYQHKDEVYYDTHAMSASTEQAVVMLASFYYESKDGGTGGFFSTTAAAAKQSIECVNDLLRIERDWKV